jgi:hypothetical protein
VRLRPLSGFFMPATMTMTMTMTMSMTMSRDRDAPDIPRAHPRPARVRLWASERFGHRIPLPAGPAHRPARRSLPVTLAYVRTPPRALKRKSDGFGGSGSPGAAES